MNLANDFASISNREDESKESWNAIDEEKKQAFMKGPFSKWSLGAGDMVKNAEKVIKVRFESSKLPSTIDLIVNV